MGLKISVHLLILEATKFLIQYELAYIWTERFSQYPLGNLFGCQYSIEARKGNSTICDFEYNDNSIGNQKYRYFNQQQIM